MKDENKLKISHTLSSQDYNKKGWSKIECSIDRFREYISKVGAYSSLYFKRDIAVGADVIGAGNVIFFDVDNDGKEEEVTIAEIHKLLGDVLHFIIESKSSRVITDKNSNALERFRIGIILEEEIGDITTYGWALGTQAIAEDLGLIPYIDVGATKRSNSKFGKSLSSSLFEEAGTSVYNIDKYKELFTEERPMFERDTTTEDEGELIKSTDFTIDTEDYGEILASEVSYDMGSVGCLCDICGGVRYKAWAEKMTDTGNVKVQCHSCGTDGIRFVNYKMKEQERIEDMFEDETKKDNKMFEGMVSASEIYDREYPEQEVVCKNTVPLAKGDLAMLSGRGGVGKGILSLTAIIEYLQTHPEGKALYWSTEDSHRTLQSRLRMYDFITKDILDRLTIFNKSVEKIKQGSDGTVRTIERATINFDMIVIDPLVAFHKGDENSNTEAADFISNLNTYVAKYDKLFLIIAHTSKEGTTARGAGAFEDNVRLAYILTNKDEDGTILEDGAVFLSTNKDNNYTFKNQKRILIPFDIKEYIPTVPEF